MVNCRIFRFLFFMLVLTVSQSIYADEKKEVAASMQLIERLLPGHYNQFKIELAPSAEGRDVFEIEQGKDGKIILRGNRAVSIVSGMNYYMKHVANCHFSWNGDQLNLPEKLPQVAGKIRRESPYKHSFNFNYCTFNYTMAWWDWERWEREIDLMAINGVDIPLAIVGIEGVWLNFLKRFGYSPGQAKAFIAGPAYTAWWLMGNLEGRGGPVTDSWIEDRIQLQQRILTRMRELGMTPALPGFVGLVPSNLDRIILSAELLDQGKWLNDTRPAVLHPDSPLFEEMARAWYEETEKLFGKADVFAGDLFHEGGKTHGLDVPAIAAKVQSLMTEYNPNAVWAIQGWGGNPRPELLNALSKENTLVVELCSEFFRNWEPSEGFYGYPWIFSTIIQYGGNVGLHGRIDAIAQNMRDALQSKNPPSGLGTTWESIEVNPVVNDFIGDMRWEENIPSVEEWLGDYAVRRYGFDSPGIRRAWQIIGETAYGSYTDHRRPTESVFCASPSLNVKKVSPFAASIEVHYDQRKFRDAVQMLLDETTEDVIKNPALRFDLVDFTRQFMANAAQIPYHEMVAAFNGKDPAGFEKAASQFLAMMDDQDRLLGTEPLFLLGKWIDDARKIANTPEQIAQNESNARTIITTWTKEKSGLGDYAWREWNGLIKTYYKPRWEMFIRELRKQLNGEMPQSIDFFSFESGWAAQTWEEQKYPIRAEGNPIKIAKELLKKWSPVIDDNTRYSPPVIEKKGNTEKSEDAR